MHYISQAVQELGKERIGKETPNTQPYINTPPHTYIHTYIHTKLQTIQIREEGIQTYQIDKREK
jgi:hypothetical protein